MKFHYKGYWIDATPDRTSETYLAQVRIVADTSLTAISESIERVGLGCFSREAFAYECAVNWALAWIDERNDDAPKQDLREG